MADNQNILNTKSFISEDWNGGYKLEIDLTAKTKINDWELDFNLPYKIRETYGVDLINHGQGNYSIDGKDHNQSLNVGQSTKAILIIDDYYQKAISPQLDLSEYNYTTPLGVNVNAGIAEDWHGGYKLEIDLTAQSKINNWKFDFNLPYKIKETYGVNLINQGNGNYSFEGKNYNQNLNAGQSTKAVFIVEDDYNRGILPQINLSEYTSNVAPELKLNADIAEDWNGGYKLEIDLTAQSKINNWKLDFNLPYKIKETYGVDLINHGQGSYSFQGQDYNQTLNSGESTKAIFIVQDDFNSAVLPEFKLSKAVSTPQPTPTTNQTNSNSGSIIDQQDPVTSSPAKGKFNYGEALQKSFLFLEANRSGDLPEDNRIEWRGDSALTDGADVGRDLTGGYYDAGDHVKFGFPMAATTTMLSWGVVEYGDAYSRSGQLDEALEAIKWSTDYMLKAHVSDENGTKEYWGQVGHSWTDHSVWDSAENMTMERPAYKIDRQNPGSDLAAETAASLAAASIVFRSSNPAYADTLLDNAQQLYDFAEEYQGKYSDSITDAQAWYYSNEFVDELAWGATWLYKATDNSDYLNKAENYYNGLGTWTYNWNDKAYGTGVLLAQETNNSQYSNDVEQWLEQWINGEGAVKRTPGGLAWLSEWGSLRYAANTAFLAGVYNDTVREDARYDKFVSQQIDYILGDNPRNASYMVGFGDNYPQQPHHRSASGVNDVHDPQANQHILYGALVGGPISTDDFDYNDVRNDYLSNEVATDYNAAFTGALARMYDVYGGDPLTEAQLDDLIGVDANGVGF